VDRRIAPSKQRNLFAVPLIEPCKPKLATKVRSGPLWPYKIKQDGYPIHCHVLDVRFRVFTENGQNWTERFPGIVASMQGLSSRSAAIEGKAMIEGEGFVGGLRSTTS
jgi:bifunctional non-homologous end joining protein LigD